MAVRIRLSRIGTKSKPFYRLVAVDSRSKRDGAMLANIGTYDAVTSSVVQFHEDMYTGWLAKGAIPTDSVKKIYKLYKKSGLSHVSSQETLKTAPVAESVIASHDAV